MTHMTCSKYSIFPQVMPAQERIVAIGDIHGDFDYLIHLLKIARVISDKNYKWIGGKTYIVQLGDQIDNCRPDHFFCYEKGKTSNDKAEDLKIIDYLDNLNTQARAVGGAVISLMGNHELLNIQNDLGYVSYENLRSVSGEEKRRDLFNYKGKYGEKIICTHPPTIIIGSNLFVHAGILPNMLDQMDTLRHILKVSSNDIIDKFSNTELTKIFLKMCLSNTFNAENQLALRNKLKQFDTIYTEKYWDNVFTVIAYKKYDKKTIEMYYSKLSKNSELIEILAPKHDEIRKLLKEICNKQVMIMHSIEVINSIIRNWLLHKINHQYLQTIEPYFDIFWTRILGSIPTNKQQNNDVCVNDVNPVLEYFRVNNMIIAHTPQFMSNQVGINNVCHNSYGGIWRTDIGGAEVFNKYDAEWIKTGKKMKARIPQILEIINDNEFKILSE